jgi:predicted RecB family nuclease
MQSTITPEIVVAYSQCPRKAYLLLFSSDKGDPHEYVQILEQQRSEHQERYLTRLQQTHADVQPYSLENLSKGSEGLINARLQVDGLEAECGVLTRVEGNSTFGKYSYEPSMFVGTYSISTEQKLTLSFVGNVLGRLQHTSPVAGTIIGVDGKAHTVKLGESAKALTPLLEPLQEWTTVDSPAPPPLVLNKHCPLCPFQRMCHTQAEQEDNLSLLDGVTARVMRQYEKKGIFTVKQLSYLFKPRKRKKGSRKPPPVTHKVELQALAIREKKIYLQELPTLSRQPVELFVDMEGVPDRGRYYLIGMLMCQGDTTEHHAFWADTDQDERDIWQQFVEKVQQYPDAPIYHYGSYEPRAIVTLAKRYAIDAESVTKRLVNVNRYIYGKVYFPVRSNRLKDIGHYLGAAWTAPHASGLQSLVWRHQWEVTHAETYKDLLLTYNAEDCHALLILTSTLTTLHTSANTLTHVDFAERPKQHATERGADIHRVFDAILKSAHTDYASHRLHLRSPQDPEHHAPKKRGAPHGHQAYQRLLPSRIGKVIRVPPRRTCPKHPGKLLQLGAHMVEHPLIDLHFPSQGGCRKTVVKYVGKKGYCQHCDKYYEPRGIEQLGGQLFGHALQAWVIYQRLILRLPYRAILQVMEELFGERASLGTLLNFVTRFAGYYAPTERFLWQRLLRSPFVHVDETKLSIQGTDQYVWVFTDGTHVVFKMTATREATIVHETLEHYAGVLISDFYPGYDAVPCRQQKCLVHLIRDLNDDLWSNPFNREFEHFVLAVKNLLVPIFEAVETYGLKRRHLHKFHSAIERFYQQHIVRTTYTTEVTSKFQKRFQRYRDTLFTFLHEDGIPWQNNMAERALRHIAVQRKISGSFFEQSTHYFLLLLGLAQTCQFQNKSFLKFLLSKTYDIDTFTSPRRVQISRPVCPQRKSDGGNR